MELSNYFAELNAINVGDKTEKKNGLTYLSWAWAWAELKKRHPEANYEVYETEKECFYFTDGKTAWVKTGVTVNGIEHIEYLPVMNHRNQSIGVDAITSFDVNKSIQRSLTKAVARHGLGLYIYAGEDLPEDEEPEKTKSTTEAKKPPNTTSSAKQAVTQPIPQNAVKQPSVPVCVDCGATIKEWTSAKNRYFSPDAMAELAVLKFGRKLCADCITKQPKE